MNIKNMYVVMHTHRHGVSTYVVECPRIPTEDEAIAACDIDFEDDRDDEFLEIDSVIEITQIP